ncbi:MAG: hypothetical protein ACKVS7_02075 [Gemmatimonadaceae bacterium]
MNSWLWAAVVLISLLGIAHSVLGERYILVRLFRRTDLPKVLGSEEFTRRTLRFAWHLTSIAWWGMAALIVVVTEGSRETALQVLAATTLVSGIVALVGSRARHLAWIVFVGVAGAIYVGAAAADARSDSTEMEASCTCVTSEECADSSDSSDTERSGARRRGRGYPSWASRVGHRLQRPLSPMTPTIRHARPTDAAALAELAARTFRDTFGADNRPDDLALHLETAYGPAQQAGELADPNIITLLADDNGPLVAFAQLRRGTPPACVVGPAPIELWRFYLAAEWQGRRVA